MAGKLRPSPTVSATAFAPGTVKRGNDGNKYVIVVASNNVPRWQKVKTASAVKSVMKKLRLVKKFAMKKSKVAVKVKPSLPVVESPYVIAENAAKDVCRRLTKGQLRLSDLGKTPDTKGYVLLRDFAKKFMSNPTNYKKFQKTYCSPAIAAEDTFDGEAMPANDPVLTTIAYLPAHIIDGMDKVDDMKILFSDEKDKHFFSLGVVSGYFRGDSANQFYYEFLVKKKYKPSQISAQLKGKDYKIMENLMVKHEGVAGLTSEH